jgi:hypothetical protein
VCEIPRFCTGARSTSPLLASEKLGIAKKDFFPREVATLLEQPSGTQLQEALFTRRRRPPCRLQRPSSATIIVLHPRSGDVALGALSAPPQRYPPPQAPTRQGIPLDSLGDRTSSSQGHNPPLMDPHRATSSHHRCLPLRRWGLPGTTIGSRLGYCLT